jgi:uncharacterized protein YdcH (DUF465 family)
MPTNSPRIQISAKVPPYLKEFLVKLDPLDNSNAVNLALEIAFKEYNKPSGENIENNAVSRNCSDYTIAEINGFATEIEKLKAENAKLKAVFETENKTDFEKATTEAFVKGYNMHESERKEAHQKGYDLAKAELHIPTPKKENTIEIDLTDLETEMVETLLANGFEPDKYLTPENEKRAEAILDEYLETQLQKYREDFEEKRKEYESKISQKYSEYSEFEHFQEFRECVIKSIRGFAKYTNSTKEKWMNCYDELYITDLYFTQNAKKLLIL